MSEPTPRLLGGRYEVAELIGRGGMAEVHLGHDARLGRPVAIKILRTDHARDASFLGRFRREAQSVAGLNHRSIVAVYDSGEDHIIESGGARLDVPYIVMEYVSGRTLREVLNEEGTLDPHEAARICEATLDALAYSHVMGIVHRDIKPGNVMLSDDGSVKVMDFGIARAVADAQATMTQTQAVIGTAQYISPEQARGETVDNRSDVYSTGCLLFELLTGRTPFVGEPISLTYQHVNAAIPRPSDLNPQVPPGLDAVVVHALAKDRADRYQDAGQMAEDLRAVQAGQPVSAAAMASLGDEGPRTEVLGAGGAAAAGAGMAGAGAAASQADPTVAMGPSGLGSSPARTDPDTSSYPAAREPRRRRGLGWLVALLVLLLVAGLGWFAWSSRTPEVTNVAVPTLVGTNEQAARSRLSSLGFSPDATPVASEEAEGEVLTQEPAAGAMRAPGSTVSYTYSSGPDTTQIPSLTGLSRAEAQQALEDAGLSVGDVSTDDDPTQPKGRVVSSNPAGLTNVARGSTVDLVVSSGRVKIGDYLGRNVDDVRQELYELGLTIKTETRESEEAEGTILEQDPRSGKVDQGSTVTFVVAKAAPTTVTTTTSEPTSSSTTSDEPTSTSTSSTPEPTSTSSSPDPSDTGSPTTPPTP